jgi:unsaturated chondroitin disaccharide hydrolase
MTMTPAVSSLVRRVDDTLEQASGRFPMYAEPATGTWTWSDDGGWFGGFWPGLLWLSAAATQDAKYAHAAAGAAARLRPRTNAPTVLRGFLYWYGAGLGFELGHASSDTADLATTAARSMAADFDPVGQLLPPGDEDASEYHWPRPGACIDGLPGTIPLLAFASRQMQDPVLRSMALAHARGHHAMCVREDGSVAQSATYDQDGNVTSQTTIDGSSKGQHMVAGAGVGHARTDPGRTSVG